MARRGGAAPAQSAEGRRRQARRLQRGDQDGGARGHSVIRAKSTASWSTPISRAARSIISWASPCRRCCGASCRAAARPAACNRWRCAWSASARPRSRRSSRANTGPIEVEFLTTSGDRFTARLTQLDGKRLDKFDLPNEAARTRRRATDSDAPGVQPSPRSNASRSGAIRRRPSPPRRCSRRPRASSASAPAAPCASPSGSTKASISAARPSVSSPTCAPTA